MMQFKNLWIIVLILSIISCIKKEEDSSTAVFQPVTASFLSVSDFTSNNENVIDQTALATGLYGVSDLWHYYSSSDNSVDASSCLKNFKINMITTDSFYVGGEEDITSCIAAALASTPEIKINKSKTKVYTQIKCAGVDLSQFSGQAITNTLSDQIEAVCGTATRSKFTNSINEADITITISGNSTRSSTITTSANMTTSGEACTETFDGTNWTRNSGCTEYSIEHYLIDPDGREGKDEITKVTFNNLVMSNTATDPFFVSGTADLYYLGWQGTVTYNGVSSNANWSMIKDGVTATGTLSATLNNIRGRRLIAMKSFLPVKGLKPRLLELNK